MFDDHEFVESDIDEMDIEDAAGRYGFPHGKEGRYTFKDEQQTASYEEMKRAGVFDELDEMALASDLLALSDRREIEQFLHGLVQDVGRKIGRFARPPAERVLTRMLQRAAKVALPMVGSAAGVPGRNLLGIVAGGKPTLAAGRAFGLELEGLSPEDKEFEVARHFIRFAADAAKKAIAIPAGAPAGMAATAAVKQAADIHAPGLLFPGIITQPSVLKTLEGRWIRRGSTIILLDV